MSPPPGANDSKTPPIVSLLAGGVAGGIEAAASYPFEFAKTRVQLRSQKGVPTPKNPFIVVSQVYRSEGLRALYKGCGALVVGSIAKDGVRFLFFDAIKNSFADPVTGTTSPLRNLLGGMTAGVVASITAVTPTERIKTALIDDARTEKRFRGGFHATKVIWQEGGILGLYRGFAGTTLKQASATAFRMGTYNILKDFETVRDIPQNTATNFANGSVAGVVTTLCTQPFDVIKTRSQSAHGASTMEAVKSVWLDYGLKGFWRGTTMRLGRTVFSGGILFTSYEAVAAILNPMFAVVKEKLPIDG
ncbi:tricarboxylate transport protein, mitochondrial precursor [Mytilinidion resinicola]|uniref:Tricarboxylate transport protein, mitochondrial n=1 Tax=Mytilinidion resinicola TaxID=574789 RepID=A0A6A6YIG3_9PEZI|nr:tricarboxylate transport protein, mitochondrial precursor [Mytilinidion resinicola]KAF2808636.1 tricarboxylate transport protein, mitochondrial precursor [Mytilinidion resinicola]